MCKFVPLTVKCYNMERLSFKDLLDWKNKKNRKPLLVEGARQVGKTWLVKEFGKRCYKEVAYVNFEERKQLRNLFDEDFDMERILFAIKTATKTNMVPGETLIFLDEIQEAHEGLTALKYFAENAPEHHVITAGSLLGVELHRKTSFPVGKIEFMVLRPLSFAEFLMAVGEQQLGELLCLKKWSTVRLFSDQLKMRLRQYFFVGGMPEAVKLFAENNDLQEVRQVQHAILATYERDFSKHAPTEIVPRIRQLWNSLPAQLSKENRKFIYGLVREGARAREYEIAIDWIRDCGLIHQICRVKAPRIPLKSYEDRSSFKIYLLDVGLLSAMCDLDQETLLRGNLVFTEFKGALTEQYVMQELVGKFPLFYWSKDKSEQEVDFLIQHNGVVVPIEVKAEENLQAKSLKSFVRENNSTSAVRTSMSDYREESWMTNVPLYAIQSYF